VIEEQYFVVLCKFCGTPRLIRSWHKSFVCFSCKRKVRTEGCRVIYKTDKVKEAIYLVQQIKGVKK
jgi:ribosomal protein L37AE/L43A